jgi:hypothetical protein
MALKSERIERGIKAAQMIEAVRKCKDVTKDHILNYLQAHLAYGSIDLDDFTHEFFVDRPDRFEVVVRKGVNDA